MGYLVRAQEKGEGMDIAAGGKRLRIRISDIVSNGSKEAVIFSIAGKPGVGKLTLKAGGPSVDLGDGIRIAVSKESPEEPDHMSIAYRAPKYFRYFRAEMEPRTYRPIENFDRFGAYCEGMLTIPTPGLDFILTYSDGIAYKNGVKNTGIALLRITDVQARQKKDEPVNREAVDFFAQNGEELRRKLKYQPQPLVYSKTTDEEDVLTLPKIIGPGLFEAPGMHVNLYRIGMPSISAVVNLHMSRDFKLQEDKQIIKFSTLALPELADRAYRAMKESYKETVGSH